MIRLATEQLVSLPEAILRLPRRRRGKRPHASTLLRWARKGLRGVHLETIRIGSTTCTSVEALQRFFDGLTALDGAHAARPAPRASDAERREAARVNKRLDEIGL
jgi:hypothetical protein